LNPTQRDAKAQSIFRRRVQWFVEENATKPKSIFRRSGRRFVEENATKQKAFSDEVCSGSSKKMRPNKKLER